jgi:hypothetical protein
MPPSLLFFIDASYCFHPFCFATSNTTAWHLNVKPSDVFFVFRHYAAPTWQLPVNLGGEYYVAKLGPQRATSSWYPVISRILLGSFEFLQTLHRQSLNILTSFTTKRLQALLYMRNQFSAAIIIEQYVTSVERPQDTLAS